VLEAESARPSPEKETPKSRLDGVFRIHPPADGRGESGTRQRRETPQIAVKDLVGRRWVAGRDAV
jgi:hypothetical protein